uniref:ATP-dependent RNA helicase n=1 Tax=Nicotiana sylvestris TaxID=4096 RepID=A0A1U7X9T1_NICSY|nr:PREDICTED: DEAD-box ATP-dependent RNA helicase 38-like [Nicotiana sylvestris]
MADSSSTTSSTTAFVADSSSATSSTAASTTAKSRETRSWADEADEIDQAEQSENASAETEIGSLQIDESKRVNNSTLDDPVDSRIEAVTSGDTLYKSAKRFEDLNLSPELLKGLYVEMKFERPSKIQEISLPMILTPPYKNLIAQAHNGSGKTTCFVLGMLSRVDPKLRAPQALCICPTRELAIQNMEVLLKMGNFTGITSELAIPADAANYIPISKRPPVSAQVVIGTPGTINKWVTARKLGMSCMKILVFDEADHMLAEVIDSLSALTIVPLIFSLFVVANDYTCIIFSFKISSLSSFCVCICWCKHFGYSFWFLRWMVMLSLMS